MSSALSPNKRGVSSPTQHDGTERPPHCPSSNFRSQSRHKQCAAPVQWMTGSILYWLSHISSTSPVHLLYQPQLKLLSSHWSSPTTLLCCVLTICVFASSVLGYSMVSNFIFRLRPCSSSVKTLISIRFARVIQAITLIIHKTGNDQTCKWIIMVIVKKNKSSPKANAHLRTIFFGS